MQSLTKSWRHYRKNFLMLSISFCMTAVPIQLLVIYAPKTLVWGVIISVIFIASFLWCGGVDVYFVNALHEGRTRTYRQAIQRLGEKVVELTVFGAGVALIGLVLLFLVLRFLNFVTALTLLSLPVLAVFGLPGIVLEEGGFMETIGEAIRLSWENIGAAILYMLLPGVGIVYVWYLGFWLPVWCFAFPLWVVLLTDLYLRVRNGEDEVN
ncbi:hypothetical protein KGY64_04785 [Candidatus Bipolaricaulota bacterium]|nr:hypothetical protein [Candidatus Bipolaricaulota bacterium]